ncbi:MAG: McHr [Candidatus Accumulibacter appositus]|uniref:McHr n=1 Tax=Candidatus Accumulibacter appositus TaxID=1454003 RepID=A0A011Q0S1_9PROT|nr:hemerythrin family protein [Accumulibacter sp.]EXI82812.1 MAG: McHr [Candidatus Accumulibacter appositus]HRF05063.1 hemerythrin family protein [Accumulibacter sp.]
MEYTLSGLLPKELLIDLPEIDVQHEEIFRRIEMLKSSSFGSKPTSLGEFHSLLDYLEWHFASEERVARQLGVDFADHARIHDENLRTLRKALAAVQDGSQDVHSFLRYTEYWFERHISDEDKPFAARLRARTV